MFGLPEITVKAMQEVFAHYPEIDQVIIYGSRAKGTEKRGSDIDLTLIGEFISEACLSQVSQDLDDLNSPYFIDLSIFSHLRSDELISHIHSAGKPFFTKKSA